MNELAIACYYKCTWHTWSSKYCIPEPVPKKDNINDYTGLIHYKGTSPLIVS